MLNLRAIAVVLFVIDATADYEVPGKEVSRLVYNRIGKAGSGSMIELFERLARRHGFKKVGPYHDQVYLSSNAAMVEDLRNLINGSVWINHGMNVKRLVADSRYAWINIVREPADRLQSLFYFAVDPETRSEKKAKHEYAKREADTKCGCARLEFSECIDLQTSTKNCAFLGGKDTQTSKFCAQKENCTLKIAIGHLDDYVFVGLTEEMDLTIRIFEKLLPYWFAGVSKMKIPHDRSSSYENQLTGTAHKGAVTNKAKAQLMQNHHFREEVEFYEIIKRRFWLTAVRLFGTGILRQRSSRDLMESLPFSGDVEYNSRELSPLSIRKNALVKDLTEERDRDGTTINTERRELVRTTDDRDRNKTEALS